MRFLCLILVAALGTSCARHGKGVVGTWRRTGGVGDYEETLTLRNDGTFVLVTGRESGTQATKKGTYTLDEEQSLLTLTTPRNLSSEPYYDMGGPKEGAYVSQIELTVRNDRLTLYDPQVEESAAEINAPYRDEVFERAD